MLDDELLDFLGEDKSVHARYTNEQLARFDGVAQAVSYLSMMESDHHGLDDTGTPPPSHVLKYAEAFAKYILRGDENW